MKIGEKIYLMNIFIITLGCKVNQYESEYMLELFLKSGFIKSESYEIADIVIINSCTVTATSDQKVRQTVNKVRNKNKDAIIVLTGCMPQAFPEIANKIKGIDIILGNSFKSDILNTVNQFIDNKKKSIKIKPYNKNENFEPIKVENFDNRTRAFIKIEDGCNRFCTYCIIPYARGRVRSKNLKDLKEEVASLAKRGYREIVLVGINLSAYGNDIGCSLCDAIEVVCSEDLIDRVRLGSLEPEQINLDVLKRISKQTKFCEQFHLSLQSGSDHILEKMNRHYNTEYYKNIVSNIRSIFRNSSITTDIMIGFPGETDYNFFESLNFVEKIGFSKMHVFSYSRRPGTEAYLYKDQISNKIKSIRSKEMLNLAYKSREKFLASQIGLIEPVLFENKNNNLYEGYTKNYTKVLVKSDIDIAGEIIEIFIDSSKKDHCIGRI